MVPGVTSMPQRGGSGEVVVAPGKLVVKKQNKNCGMVVKNCSARGLTRL